MHARWRLTAGRSGYPDAGVLIVLHVPGPRFASAQPWAAFYRMTLEMICLETVAVQTAVVQTAVVQTVVVVGMVVKGSNPPEEEVVEGTGDGRTEDGTQRPRVVGLFALCIRRSWLQ